MPTLFTAVSKKIALPARLTRWAWMISHTAAFTIIAFNLSGFHLFPIQKDPQRSASSPGVCVSIQSTMFSSAKSSAHKVLHFLRHGQAAHNPRAEVM